MMNPMNTTRRARSLAAIAAATTLALSACGGGDEDSSEETSSATTSSQSETTQESPEEETETEEEASEETEEESTDTESEESEESENSAETDESSSDGSVTASKSGVSFDAPDGWTSVDPADILNNSGDAPKALEDMAKAQGTDADTLLQSLAQSVDVMIIGETRNNFADNINVVASPTAPTEADLKSQLEQIGATVKGTEKVDTPLGSSLDSTYTLPAGGVTVQGRMLAIPTDQGAAIITISTSDAGTSAELAKAVLDSVEKA